MTYFIITYGCAMNYSDSERIAIVLEKIGYKPAKNEDSADLIVMNACSVRQSAVDRIFSKIHNLKHSVYKTQKYILTGCVLGADKKKMTEKFDLVFNIKNLAKLPRMLSRHPELVSPQRDPAKAVISGSVINGCRNKSGMTTTATALIPISTGCNNYCSYCVVPYVRGALICRPAKQIIRDAKRAIKNGAKEIWLLGQNVNSYCDTNSLLTPSPLFIRERVGVRDNKINFPQLLKTINNLSGDFWIKFISSHPKDMSDELIRTVAECEKVCKYIHLPIQSGDNTILKKMNRRYTVTHYKNLIKKIRVNIPDVAISTDVIVGFPGETKKQFENTAKLMREIKFGMAYLAKYSPRPQTSAFKLKDNVPNAEKRRREYVLNEILKKTALKNNQKYIGKTVKILIEKVIKNPPFKKEGTRGIFLFGKTATNKNIKILLPRPACGKRAACPPKYEVFGVGVRGDFIMIKITSATSWGLSGKLI